VKARGFTGRVSTLSTDQISIKTQDRKYRLFLKIDQETYLAAGVYLTKAPDPSTHLLIHTGKGGGGGGGEQEGSRGSSSQEGSKIVITT
jgi:hypothetical protein